MIETNKKSILQLLLASLGMGLLLASICFHFQGGIAQSESQIQIIKNITPKEAYALILKNKDNQSFVILDVRTPSEFANGHIENAVNLDYYSETGTADLIQSHFNRFTSIPFPPFYSSPFILFPEYLV